MAEEEVLDPYAGLYPFITEAKVTAFISAYRPCKDGEYPDKQFTDTELRKFFNAYHKTFGDPLSLYIDEYLIKKGGFSMVIEPLLGEPVLPVKFR